MCSPSKLIVLYIPTVKSFAERYRLNKQDKEDLVQNTLLKLWSNYGQLLEIDIDIVQFRSWLHRIMYNAFIDIVRKNSTTYAKEVPYQSLPEPLLEVILAHEPCIDEPNAAIATLKEATKTFDESEKQIIEDICVCGRSIKETANKYERSRRDVSRVIYHAQQAVLTYHRNFYVSTRSII